MKAIVRSDRARSVLHVFVASCAVALIGVVGCSSGEVRQDGPIASSEQRVVRLPDGGYAVETDAWTPGSYNFITNSCHQAANAGVGAGNDGIISCNGQSSGPGGHTINWSNPANGTVCISEPQRPGQGPVQPRTCNGTTASTCMAVTGCGWIVPNGPCTGTPTGSQFGPGGTCCFPATVTNGRPDLSSAAAIACLRWGCGNQYSSSTTALPAGQLWPVGYLDCTSGGTATQAACVRCCNANVAAIPASWGTTAQQQAQAYLRSCLASCGVEAGTTTTGGGGGTCSAQTTQAACNSTYPPGSTTSCGWTLPNGPCTNPSGYRPPMNPDPVDLDGCQQDSDCGSGKACDQANNTCVPDGTCDSEDGICMCDTDADCPSTAPLCNPDFNFCMQCLGDGDCPSGTVCDAAGSGQCIGKPTDSDSGTDAGTDTDAGLNMDASKLDTGGESKTSSWFDWQ